jgi:hypothetical protein
VQALADAIQNNRHHLEELELDLHDVEYLEASMTDDYGWVDDPDILMDILLARNCPSPQSIFPSLRDLRLRGAPLDFESTRKKLYRTIDFGALESLSLRDCEKSGLFLAMLKESPKPINLKSFEIQTRHHTDAEVGRFVGSFEGLVDLFVGAEDSERRLGRPPQDALWDSLRNHRATLKRLVYHKTTYDRYCSRAGPASGYPLDCTYFAIPRLGPDEEEVDPAVNPLTGLDLECLGLCYQTDLFVSCTCLSPETRAVELTRNR